MNAHTPGPWVVGPVDDTVVTHVGADGIRYEIAVIEGDYNQPDEWPIMEANARLVAAAPDLLNACLVAAPLLACYQNDDAMWACFTQIHAALAKVEGRK